MHNPPPVDERGASYEMVGGQLRLAGTVHIEFRRPLRGGLPKLLLAVPSPAGLAA